MSFDPGYEKRSKEPGYFDVAVMRRSASAVLVVLAVCLFGGAQCGEKYWWMDQGSELNILAFCSPILPVNFNFDCHTRAAKKSYS